MWNTKTYPSEALKSKDKERNYAVSRHMNILHKEKKNNTRLASNFCAATFGFGRQWYNNV